MKNDLETEVKAFLALVGADLEYRSYDNEKELKDYISGSEYQKNDDDECLYFAIGMPSFGATPTNDWDWTIYMSARYPDNIPDTKFDQTSRKPNKDAFEKYGYRGYALLQNLVAQFTLRNQDGVPSTASIGAATIEGTTKAYTKDEFMDGIGGSLAFFFLLIFIAPQYRFISLVVEEKASRAREGMKIMGLKDAPYWLSWFVYYLGVCITISLICSVILVAFVFKNSSWFFIFLFVMLYGMSIYSYSMLICSLLQRPRVASILSTLIHFISYFLVVPVADPGVSTSSKTIASFVPNIAMAL